MSMTDPIADMLPRIRNAQRAQKAEVSMPASNVMASIAMVLRDEGYISGFNVSEEAGKRTQTLTLIYYEGKPVIAHIARRRSPGLRVYKGKDELPKVQSRLGIAYVNTTQGVKTDSAER